MIDLNERAKEVHKANEKWWRDLETGEPIERNKGEFLMLVISELAEAMEGERKDLMDTHLPHRKMAEVEMADAYIRLLDYAGGFDIDVSNVSIAWNAHKDFLLSQMYENKAENLYDIVHVLEFETQTEQAMLIGSFLGIYAYCERFGYNLEGAYHEKMAYNATREDHKHEARMQANGKKF